MNVSIVFDKVKLPWVACLLAILASLYYGFSHPCMMIAISITQKGNLLHPKLPQVGGRTCSAFAGRCACLILIFVFDMDLHLNGSTMFNPWWLTQW